jgi:hypothetical protein
MVLESLPGRLTSDIQGLPYLGPRDVAFSGGANPNAHLLLEGERTFKGRLHEFPVTAPTRVRSKAKLPQLISVPPSTSRRA